ncbi:MAG TPA: gamma carbonic anhydrase family protein [Gemmataceae bacterium]|jgi:carbonic anhydrase/acetyltransferase-like protein (isoleucine patch superfamily)|nr:gamma carbonic anhydrase family protein [Gemmataceae bacterium]
MRVVKGAYLADGVVVTGDVVLGAGVNLWFGAIVRGDLARITLGDTANIQDGCILHTDVGVPLTIESGVVAGHAVVLHGTSVGADTLLGIGCRLLSGSDIGPECIVAAGSVVIEGAKIPPRSVVMGIPGKVVRTATIDEIAKTRAINARYLEMARRYAEGRIERPYES